MTMPDLPARISPVEFGTLGAMVAVRRRGKAQRVASVIFDAIHDNVARKVDVLASETALRADIQALRHDLDAKITGMRADLALIEHRLMTRLGGLAVVLSGIIITVLHYWQPNG
jgi:hypothetical protein